MMPTMTVERDIVDGFTMSASQLLVPTSSRALTLGQMDVLRRASAMRPRHYVAPLNSEEPVKAFSQNEYQVSVMPGSYVWGLSFAMLNEDEGDSAALIHVQITDVCTEAPFFADYVRGINFVTDPELATDLGYPVGTFRAPFLLTQPRLIGDPAKLDVEIYNSASVDLHPQLVLFVAEPCLAPDQMEQLLRKAGYLA
jgi:hypothetical protein